MLIPNNLICPICKTRLSLSDDGRSLKCEGEKIHLYDIAASGYVNLLPPGKMKNARRGDGRDMLRARVDFLSGGYYDMISDSIADIIAARFANKAALNIVDCGCGEGYHITRITEKLSQRGIEVTSIGIDASKYGADMGAKRAKNKELKPFFAAGNIFSLPVSDKSVDVLLSMFAPIPEIEASRVLSDNGVVLVCASGIRHLWEMRCVIYDEPRENLKGIKCPEGFEKESEVTVSDFVHLGDGETVKNLFTMTPFYHRCPYEGRERLNALEMLDVTVEAVLAMYKRI